MAEMSRGKILASGTNGGSPTNIALSALIDVDIPGTPAEGTVLMYLEGKWRPFTLSDLKALLSI